MDRTALVMMADSDHAEGRGRMTTLLTLANDLGEQSDIYFHGAGVNWLAAFDAREHPFTQAYGERFDGVRDRMVGACNFCATVRFEVADSAERLGIPIVGDAGQHHSLGEVVRSGAQLITF